jgi:hypothetical protein
MIPVASGARAGPVMQSPVHSRLERVQIQAVNVDLREAVIASPGGSPTVGRWENWSSGLKIWAFAPHAPAWRLLERGDRMDPGAQIRALIASFRRRTAPSKRGKDPFRGA